MKATISYEGVRVECEDASAKELQELIFAIKDGPKKQTVCDKAAQAKRGRPRTHEEVSQLGAAQQQTWQYLLAHHSADGVSADEYAKDAGLELKTARIRLTKLVSLGIAHRVKRGRYRSGPGEK